MATTLKLTRRLAGIQATNETETVNTMLPHSHPAAKLFPSDRDTIFVKAKITPKGDVAVLNPCKAWRQSQ